MNMNLYNEIIFSLLIEGMLKKKQRKTWFRYTLCNKIVFLLFFEGVWKNNRNIIPLDNVQQNRVLVTFWRDAKKMESRFHYLFFPDPKQNYTSFVHFILPLLREQIWWWLGVHESRGEVAAMLWCLDMMVAGLMRVTRSRIWSWERCVRQWWRCCVQIWSLKEVAQWGSGAMRGPFEEMVAYDLGAVVMGWMGWE